ncbi:MAG: calcium-binding protein [Bacteroidota bacterium]
MYTDQALQDFIDDEITVDCYDDWEVASAWETCLFDNLNFPFKAKAPIKKRGQLPTMEKVEVVEFAKLGGSIAYVGVDWNGMIFNVPLLDLEDIEADQESRKYIEAWRYWNK